MSEWSVDKTVFVLKALGADPKQVEALRDRSQGMVSCPFHKDKTPSFSVKVREGLAYCFSCHESGHLGKFYSDKFGRTVEKDMGEERDFFANPLKRSIPSTLSFDEPPAVSLKFEGETVPVERSKTALDYLAKRKAAVGPLAEMGAFYCVTGGTVAEDGVKTSMKDRLCIPIYEYSRGKRLLLAIEGRACSPPVPGRESFYKKVLYPHGSSVNTLFETWKLDKSEPLYVVEGLMDLAALREDEDFKNSTTVFGAAITSRQAYLLKGYDVYYLQDADEAGEHTIKTLKSKLETFHYLPKNKVDFMKDHAFKDMGDVNRSGLSIGELKAKRFFSSFAKFPE